MRNEPAFTPKPGHKRAYDLTKRSNSHLITIEAEICIAYVSALGFHKVAGDWANPPEVKLPDGFKLKIEGGLPTATVDGETLSGFELVAWLAVGSKSKGIHLIKLGALVLLGARNLSEFKELNGYNPTDPHNSVLRVLNLVETASKYTAGKFRTRAKETNTGCAEHGRQANDGCSEVKSTEVKEGKPQGALPLHIAAAEDDATSDSRQVKDSPVGNNPDAPNGEDGHEDVCPGDSQVPEAHPGDSKRRDGQTEEDHPGDDGDRDRHQGKEAPVSDDRTDASALSPKKASETITKKAAKAILTAFNEEVPDLATCLNTGRTQVLDRTCWEIRVGRLLVQKKDEIKVTSVFTDWKARHFPDWDKNVLSRCYRYGMYEKRLKSKRGLLLQNVDVVNCTKKAMLLIGGYGKKNVDELVDEVIFKLDSGAVLNEEVAAKLVNGYKAKMAKPKPKPAVPSAPRTLKELHELPEQWLSRTGKKHMTELQELLESLELLVGSPQEAGVVLPLVRVFTNL